MRYKVTYDSEYIRKSGKVLSKGCTCIAFRNTGSVAATLNKNISMPVGDPQEEFNNLPNETIDQDFDVVFSSSTGAEVLVIRKFVKPIK